ncbi:FtsQ-type POTRA domain-containing protein [Microbacterium xanthum]|uniref:FtsQ-type POTRA domain-containing protein n=1 Tax=Microbacterium xanthum TaxID=3079794 RepID=UPI002AD2DB03|nr:FtsQ-type POTRA domain-containing protein [Microbacterium sp. KSW-48]MDZ8172523.1 FtsQ-type POTRA domain-containing protein [Microbacterium sp. KSW-48]
MRRPAPLPPPPRSNREDETERRAESAHADPAAGATAVGEDSASDAGRTSPTDPDRRDVADTGVPAPVRDLHGDRGHRDASDQDATVDSAEQEQVGWRAVWRAARARRRALRAEMRRFTARQRRRRAVWLWSVGALVALVVVTLGAAYSPLFAVERIRVVGAESLDSSAVEDALAGQLGTPLPLVDESAVKAMLVTFPLVETYTLEARPPHELVVRIVERTPVGVISGAAGYTLVDAAGVTLSTTPEVPEGEPVLDIVGGTDSAAFEAVGHVVRSLPEGIRAQVTGVAATSADDVTLTLGGTDTEVVWGNAAESALKALVLERQMAVTPPEEVSLYDVSSPDVVVVG